MRTEPRTPIDMERLLTVALVVMTLCIGFSLMIALSFRNTLRQRDTNFRLSGFIPHETVNPKTGEAKVLFVPAYAAENVKVEVQDQ